MPLVGLHLALDDSADENNKVVLISVFEEEREETYVYIY